MMQTETYFKELEQILEPFEIVSTFLSGQSKPTLHRVIPCWLLIMKNVNEIGL